MVDLQLHLYLQIKSREESVRCIEKVVLTYIHYSVKRLACRKLLLTQEPSLGLCDDLEGWKEAVWKACEGGVCIYTYECIYIHTRI